MCIHLNNSMYQARASEMTEFVPMLWWCRQTLVMGQAIHTARCVWWGVASTSASVHQAKSMILNTYFQDFFQIWSCYILYMLYATCYLPIFRSWQQSWFFCEWIGCSTWTETPKIQESLQMKFTWNFKLGCLFCLSRCATLNRQTLNDENHILSSVWLNSNYEEQGLDLNV